MENFDKKFGIALVVMSTLSCFANVFDTMPTPLMVANFVLGIFALVLTMMKTYHYQSYYNQNSSWFWFTFSAVTGVILVAIIYGTGLEVINQRVGFALISGLFPMMLPVLGIFIGDVGRILLRGETSAI